MPDTPPVIPAAWYPDPEGGPRQRYWDGTQWTEHYHPPLTGAESTAPAQATATAVPAAAAATSVPAAGAADAASAPAKPRGKGLMIGIIAGATALVLGTTAFFVWGVPAINSTAGSGGLGAAVTEPDWDYAYTAPIVVEADKEFEFQAGYDLRALAEEAGAVDPDYPEVFDPSFAFDVFIDPALTLHAEFSVYQPDPGKPVQVRSNELSSAEDKDFNEVELSDPDVIFGWGLNSEYYLVRKLDESGVALPKPIVTKFTVDHGIAAPIVTFSTPDNNGNLTMEWEPVEGASEYIIITTHRFGRDWSTSRIYSVLDRVSDTSWSSEASSFESDVAPFLLTQNEDMNLYGGGGSADSIQEGFSTAGDESEYTYGVIATDGDNFSGTLPYNAKDIAASLPYEVAFGANRDLKVWGPSGYIEGIENVQTTLPFTGLDGQTRSTVAYIVPEEVVDYGDRWVLALRGRGTLLGTWAPVTKASVPDLGAAIAQFNARAEELAPPTGMPDFDVISAPIDELANGLKTPPATEYPIYGSSEFVKFIAQHMIAQTPVIDIADFVNQPGVPAPYDAAQEAMYQNPYVVNVEGLNLGDNGRKLYVSYYNSKAETEALQKAIFAKTNEVVAAVITDGMTDAEKVTALNDWLVANSDYNYEALAARDANAFGGLPTGYENSWNASGNLVDGSGVCASYSYGFNALANAAGVETVVVNGDVINGGAHAWNKVKIDGAWYAVDVTWNDSPAGNRYLIIPDSGFTDSATRIEGNAWITDVLQKNYATP